MERIRPVVLEGKQGACPIVIHQCRSERNAPNQDHNQQNYDRTYCLENLEGLHAGRSTLRSIKLRYTRSKSCSTQSICGEGDVLPSRASLSSSAATRIPSSKSIRLVRNVPMRITIVMVRIATRLSNCVLARA